jgi:hypothetical protein
VRRVRIRGKPNERGDKVPSPVCFQVSTVYKPGRALYGWEGQAGRRAQSESSKRPGRELTFGERSRVAGRERSAVAPPRHPPRLLVRYTPARSMVMRAESSFLHGLIAMEANVTEMGLRRSRDFPRFKRNAIGSRHPVGGTLCPLIPPCLGKELDGSCDLDSKALFPEGHAPPPLDSSNNEGPWIGRLGNFQIPGSKIPRRFHRGSVDRARSVKAVGG